MKKLSLKPLALALCFGALTGAASASTNLIVNGSFEDISETTGVQQLNNGSWQVFSTIPGWITIAGAGIEVRNNVAGSAQNGSQFVELDSHSYVQGKPKNYNSNSTMLQNIGTTFNENYTLSFWYSPRPNTATGFAADTNNIGVYWNGAALGGTLSGTNGTGSNNWLKYTYTVTGTGGTDMLKFSALGTEETYGGSLDNVSLISAIPEPGTYTMLLAGLGLMGIIARRRKTPAARAPG